MKEDIFLKIGGNQNVWDTYSSFTLCKGVIELDLVLNIEFFLTVFFMFYDVNQGLEDNNQELNQWRYYFLGFDIFFFAMLLLVNLYSHIIINRKQKNFYCIIAFFRTFGEIFKVFKVVISIMGVYATFEEIPPLATD
mmetsp:Transcript_23961/g.18286  ORF Transcript_23961/g.18286 Transcript_23961/m.18286 type:complete len:137 (+) Transcript_23961:253-663(+)|eukprot:CAMPEP_0202960874 /NCGR_PEP_ID=MMETSP1396-20130829/5017_1 /ASSEMBLY_ACC=CAM_ASM_000872 /TAXON_ID= /ORGANISM="Pseudokeronopsis sp., Strain Brazil" /LENGTH=136 /DNA_ID=CAMNT_0049680379 /DNA_START=442 /DNA_END=852 /DNA_ORIENTATION=+